MKTIRDARPEDIPQIEAIHQKMGIDYGFPDMSSPLFFVGKVVEENGEVTGACFLRLTAETYLWINPELTAREKYDVMLELQPVILEEAFKQGIDEIEARIETKVEKKFCKRLNRLGWTRNRDGWHPYTRSTNA